MTGKPAEERRSGIIPASWAGTAVFTVVASAAAIWPSALQAAAFAVSVGLFVAGVVLFFWAYASAVVRSQTDEIAVTSLFFLAGSAPTRVRWHLLGSMSVETVVAVAAAAVRPFTALAAGVLVPVYGLALCGLWAARHGTFPPRVRAEPHRSSRRETRHTPR